MKMNIDRIWIIGISGAILIVGVLGWLLGISPVVAQAGVADQQRASISAANQASEAKIAVLKKQFANVGKVQTQLDQLGVSVPSDPDLALFLREIDSLTNQFQVSLTNVTVSSAQKYVPAVVTPPATTGSSTATPTPSPSAAAGTTATPIAPVEPGPGGRLLVVPVKIDFAGSYENVMNLIGALQSGDRLFLMVDMVVKSSITGAPKAFQANLSGNVYALPKAATAAAALGASAANAPSATPSPSTAP